MLGYSIAAHGKSAVARAFDVITRRAVVDVWTAAVVDDALPRGSDPVFSRRGFGSFSHGQTLSLGRRFWRPHVDNDSATDSMTRATARSARSAARECPSRFGGAARCRALFIALGVHLAAPDGHFGQPQYRRTRSRPSPLRVEGRVRYPTYSPAPNRKAGIDDGPGDHCLKIRCWRQGRPAWVTIP